MKIYLSWQVWLFYCLSQILLLGKEHSVLFWSIDNWKRFGRLWKQKVLKSFFSLVFFIFTPANSKESRSVNHSSNVSVSQCVAQDDRVCMWTFIEPLPNESFQESMVLIVFFNMYDKCTNRTRTKELLSTNEGVMRGSTLLYFILFFRSCSKNKDCH